MRRPIWRRSRPGADGESDINRSDLRKIVNSFDADAYSHAHNPLGLEASTPRVLGGMRLTRTTFEREPVLAKLDTAASEPLTIVHAPARFGKTTLLAQWARRRERAADRARVFALTV